MNVLRFNAPVARRGLLLAVGHLVLFALSYRLAYALRFDFAIPRVMVDLFWTTFPWICGLKLALYYLFSHFHGSWRFVTFADLAALLRAATASLLVIAAIDYFFTPEYQIPRAVLLLDCVLSVVCLGGSRSTSRLYRETYFDLRYRAKCRKALIIGANASGGQLAQQIRSNPKLNFNVVGFLDPDAVKHGTQIGGIPVLGGLKDASRIAAAVQARDILVVDSRLTGSQLRQVMAECEPAGLTLKVIPAMENVLNGTGPHRIPLRDIDINDLLRREPVQMDCDLIGQMLRSRTVMITGAGGSIGSEICRQVLKFQPKEIVLVERFENNLFLIERELRATCGDVILLPCIADVTDKPRMRGIFESHAIDVVFHAAAHKHVPMMEHNPGEAIKNNVLGTKGVADLADQFGVASFVLISTDKAVNPSSVMGVTKQLAERCIYTLSQKSQTRFVAVRFGNVLGSAGSVIPVFQEQIRRGGPITVTHPDMERFFMTIPEASQLVLQAAALGKGGEIFVLDMGEPVKIVDLARDLIHLSGLGPDDIEIHFTGTRPGEKLYEELYLEDEKLLPSAHPKIRMATHRRYAAAEIALAIQQLTKLVHEPDGTIRRALRDLVPEYVTPQEARPIDVEILPADDRKAA